MKIDELLGNHTFLLTELYEKQSSIYNKSAVFCMTFDKPISEINDALLYQIFNKNFYLVNDSSMDGFLDILSNIHSLTRINKILISNDAKVTITIVDDFNTPSFTFELNSGSAAKLKNKLDQRQSFFNNKDVIDQINKNKKFYIVFSWDNDIDWPSDFFEAMKIIESKYKNMIQKRISEIKSVLSTESLNELKKIEKKERLKFSGFNDAFKYHFYCSHLMGKMEGTSYKNNKYAISYSNLKRGITTMCKKIHQVKSKKIKTYKMQSKRRPNDYTLIHITNL